MKISVKMAIISSAIVIVAVTVCCLLVITFTRTNTYEAIKNTANTDYAHFTQTFYGAVNMGGQSDTALTKRSLVKLYFTGGHGANEYVLQQNDDFICNNTGIDPLLAVGGIASDESARTGFYSFNGNSFYIVCGNVSALGEEYTLSLVRDVTKTLSEVDSLAVKCASACAGVAILAAILLTFMIWRQLRPIKQLEAGAQQIADGHYDSRIEIKGKNELSALAGSFNSMAEATEDHIRKIEATSEERRRLLSALSHEMKTPVTAISGYSHALTHSCLTEEQRNEALTFINSECLRLERLSGKLMQLISLEGEGLTLEIISTEALAEALSQILQPIAKASGVSLLLKSNGQTLFAEQDLIVCLITNLFDNSKKADAKHIDIELSNIEIIVRDDGRGIPKDELSKITQPFYVLDKSRNTEGLGLGLAIASRIAELHHGQLLIKSEAGHGTEVSLQFPYNSQTTSKHILR